MRTDCHKLEINFPSTLSALVRRLPSPKEQRQQNSRQSNTEDNHLISPKPNSFSNLGHNLVKFSFLKFLKIISRHVPYGRHFINLIPFFKLKTSNFIFL